VSQKGENFEMLAVVAKATKRKRKIERGGGRDWERERLLLKA